MKTILQALNALSALNFAKYADLLCSTQENRKHSFSTFLMASHKRVAFNGHLLSDLFQC